METIQDRVFKLFERGKTPKEAFRFIEKKGWKNGSGEAFSPKYISVLHSKWKSLGRDKLVKTKTRRAKMIELTIPSPSTSKSFLFVGSPDQILEFVRAYNE